MWIVRLALSRPYTFIVMALVIILLTPVVLMRTPTDIFPEINIPVISLIWNYAGLQPQEMEQRITSNSERFVTTLVNDVEHTESQSLNGIAVVKIYFQPTANIQTALAQTTAIMQTILRNLPPGSTPPLVAIFSASTVPVIQIGLTSDTLGEQTLFDFGNNFIRTQLATVRGAALPFPYGGKQRTITVDLDSTALQSKGLSPVDIVNAVNAQNLILPTGTAKMGPLEYTVEMNGSPQTIAELNDLPVKTVNGATIYLREVAHVRDGFTPQTNIVRANGERGALMSAYKTGSASTLAVVKGIKDALKAYAPNLPPGLHLTMFFDQSLYVDASIQGVLREALIAACLTAIMILLFLGNWKSTLIIAISIPLSILVSVLLLSALGETINIMTLGGLALAVGILVDDATVEIENINRNLAMGKETVQAILDGAQQIAVPAFVSTLCICIVFLPMFFLTGVARYLFVPLAEAVSFAMLASDMWSRTIVPTLAMYLLSSEDEYIAEEHLGEKQGSFRRYQQKFEHGFEKLRAGYRRALGAALANSRLFAACFLAFCVASGSMIFLPWPNGSLGKDFFPKVDAGQIRLHFRARTGLRIEETARLADQIDSVIRQTIPRKELETILDNLGVPYSGINLSYSNSGTWGTADGEILVQLKQERGRPTSEYINDLRERLPQLFPGTQFFFQPADIVTQILNFGTPAPIDVAISGPNVRGNYAVAQKLANEVKHIPGAVDVHVQQALDEPTLHMDIDRTRVQSVGLQAKDVAQNLLVSLSSSFQTAPSFWLDPRNGVSYNVAVQSPQYRVDSYQALQNTPVTGSAPGAAPQILGNLARTSTTTRPAVVSHYNVMPMINVYASVNGRDLGGVSDDLIKKVDALQAELPPGSRMVLRGQVQTMRNSFQGLALGVLGAIILVYLLIVVNFQSWLDPFIIITALPGALAGICWMLLITHTTLSVPSLTGAIMCVGVATSNSILMVSFAREQMAEGKSARDAALEAGFVRIRPVIMTALAMIIGMVPMAIGLGEGGEQNAPLGRAVIGGLIFATFATLFFVPCVFSIIHGRRQRKRAEGSLATA